MTLHTCLVLAFLPLLCPPGIFCESYITGNCSRGQYRHKDNEASYFAECRPCPDGEYNDNDHNDDVSCQNCTNLTMTEMKERRLTRLEECTKTSNTKYGCRDGYINIHYYDTHPPEIPICVRKKSSPLDHMEKRPATTASGLGSSTLIPEQVPVLDSTNPSLDVTPTYDEEGRGLQNSTNGTTHTNDIGSRNVLAVVLSIISLVIIIVVITVVVCWCKRRGRARGTDEEVTAPMNPN